MVKRVRKKRDYDFLLENSYHRKLQLYLYFASIGVIVLSYFVLVYTFSTHYNTLITGIISVIIGVTLVYHKEKLIKMLGETLHQKKRKKMKKENKEGLKTTLNKITPKPNRNIKFSVKGKDCLKDKCKALKAKLKKENTSSQDYIEIK